MNFMGLNLADLGAHAEQLKTLVTAVLNRSQESSENAKLAADNTASAIAAVEHLAGAVLLLTEKLAKVEAFISQLSVAEKMDVADEEEKQG